MIHIFGIFTPSNSLLLRTILVILLLIYIIGPYIYYLAQIIYKYTLAEKNLIQRYGIGSWALITGASSGQGQCMAFKLAARGFNLILIGSERTTYTISGINEKWPTVQIKFIEKDFSESYDDSWWQNDIIPLFNGDYDISILFNNVGQRSACKPSYKQPFASIMGSIITGTVPQVQLTNLAIEYMITRPGEVNSAIIFNTAQCIHPVIGLSQYYNAEITVPYLSVYEATNAFGYFHANSILAECLSDPKYKNIDMLNITPGAVLTQKTEFVLHNTMFAVKADKFVDNILRLMGNWQGTTCAYWGHELSPILISLAPWLKRRILSEVGQSFIGE
jgi:short-subunit dehydrogenase